MWRKAHAANQEDPVYEKPQRDAKEVELSPNVPCQEERWVHSKESEFSQSPDTGCGELKQFSVKIFHEANKFTGQAKNKAGQIGSGGSTKPTVGSLIGSKARVLPSPLLNTVVQQVLAKQ